MVLAIQNERIRRPRDFLWLHRKRSMRHARSLSFRPVTGRSHTDGIKSLVEDYHGRGLDERARGDPLALSMTRMDTHTCIFAREC